MNPFALTAEERAGAMMAPARAPDVGAFMDNIEALRTAMGGSLASRMARRGDEQQARWDAGERSPTPLTEENIWLADDVAGALLGPMGMAGVIKAYHGSPHRFSKFSMDKIGTGEGAQAYGHGLYFSEHPSVAMDYKTKLSDDTLDPRYIFNGKEYGRGDPEWKILGTLKNSGAGEVKRLMSQYAKDEAAGAAYIVDDPKMAESVRRMREFLSGGMPKKSEIKTTSGALYTTRLDVDPEDLLDWDVPLSEQSAKVRAALESLIARLNSSSSKAELANIARAKIADGTATGGDIIKGLEWTFRRPGAFPGIQLADRPAVSAALRESGVPGIRYLDQGSRASGEGTRNFVIFDDSLISIESVE